MSESELCEEKPVLAMNHHSNMSHEVEKAAEELRLKRIEEQNKRMYNNFLREHPDGRLIPKY